MPNFILYSDSLFHCPDSPLSETYRALSLPKSSPTVKTRRRFWRSLVTNAMNSLRTITILCMLVTSSGLLLPTANGTRSRPSSSTTYRQQSNLNRQRHPQPQHQHPINLVRAAAARDAGYFPDRSDSSGGPKVMNVKAPYPENTTKGTNVDQICAYNDTKPAKSFCDPSQTRYT